MKNMITTDTLRERIRNNSKKLRTTVSKGNVRGIGVESMMSESKQQQVSRNKARILKKMSPSLDRGLQILAGMIACPEGGVQTNLNYNFGDIDNLSEEKRSKILTELKEYFEQELDLENDLHDLVYRVLSEIGADVEVYIPTGIAEEALGLESAGNYEFDTGSNKNKIKYPKKTNAAIGTSMNLLMETPIEFSSQVGLESENTGRSRLSRINKTTLALAKDKHIAPEGVIVRRTTGESIIPILYNGRVIKYVGLLDEMGNFLATTDSTAFIDLMSQTEDASEKSEYEILAHDSGLDNNAERDSAYKNIRKSIEDDVIMALTGDKNIGGMDQIVESLGEENVLDILTARSLAEKKTRVIMIDPEYVSYFSLIQNDHGRGITVIEDNSSIILLHVTLLYAKILSELESSIPKTSANITLDENDENADATLKDIMGEISMSAVPDYNFDYSGNRDLFRSLGKLNTSVKVMNADVPGMPNMDIEVERTQNEMRGPSSDLLQEVGKFATQVIGISAEHVDNSYSEKFKLQVTRDNDITSRQQARYVAAVNKAMTDRGQKRVSHNNDIWNRLIDIIGGSNAETVLIEILATLTIKLPEQTSSKFENFSLNMESVSRALEDYLKFAIPDTVIDNGERIDSDSLATWREMVIGSVIRSYAQNSDLFGGLGLDLTSMGGMADIALNELDDYGDTFQKMVGTIRKFNKKIEKAENKLNAEEEEEEPVVEPTVEPPVEPAEEPTEGGTTEPPEEESSTGGSEEDPLTDIDQF